MNPLASSTVSSSCANGPSGRWLRLLWLGLLFTFAAGTAIAWGIVDPYNDIPNAFLQSGTAVRAVFDGTQLISVNGTRQALQALRSEAYVLCGLDADDAADVDSSRVAALVNAWCSRGSAKGAVVRQSISWSTSTPPGLQPATLAGRSSRSAAWDCLTYSCDLENFITVSASGATNGSSSDASGYHVRVNATGGLHVAAPCGGSTNSTIVLYMIRGLLVQAAVLPVSALNDEAAALYNAFVGRSAAALRSASGGNDELDDDNALQPASLSNATTSLSSSSLSSRTQDLLGSNFSDPMHSAEDLTFCLVRPRPSAQQGSSGMSLSDGDGGVSFAVDVLFCGSDLSDRIDARDASLMMRGYTAVLVTADGVGQLSFPKELILSITSWVVLRETLTPGDSSAKQGLVNHGGACTWGFNASEITVYRNGEYMDCAVRRPPPHTLPPLLLSVRMESIVSAAEVNSTCEIAIDLTDCLQEDGATLRFYSTGSLVEGMQGGGGAAGLHFHDPAIVLGVQQLRGATVAVTRHAKIAQWEAEAPSLGQGLPLLYMAVPRVSAGTASNTSSLSCVTPMVCHPWQTYYPSLNLCASDSCIGVFLYSFDADTFTCTPRSSMVTAFAALCVTLLVAEGVVLYLRRKAEHAKEDHVQLVLQVQRRSTEVTS